MQTENKPQEVEELSAEEVKAEDDKFEAEEQKDFEEEFTGETVTVEPESGTAEVTESKDAVASEEGGDKTGAVETEGSDQSAATEETSKTPDAADKGAEATPPTIADVLETVKEGFESQNKRIRKMEGHYGSLQGSVQELSRNIETAETAKEIPTKEAIAAAVNDGEKFSKLKADFPDWGEGMDEAMQTIIEATSANQIDTEKLIADIGQQTQTYVQGALAENKVETAHEGWGELVASDKFVEWQNEQPEEVQMLAQSANPNDAIRLIDLYQEQMEASQVQESSANADEVKTAETKTRLEEAAAIPNSGNAPPKKGPSEEEDFLEGFKTG